MKILMVSDDLFAGGAAKHVVDLSNELQYRGHDVTVAAGNGEYISKLDPAIRFYPLQIFNVEDQRKSLKGLISSYTVLRRLIHNNDYDIVHTHKRITNALVKFMFTSHKANHITSFHNVFHDKKILTYFGDFSICCSDTVREVMTKHFRCPADRSATVHYGIFAFREYNNIEKQNVYSELGIDSSKKVISSVGLFAPYKDRKNLVRAINILKENKFSNDLMFIIQGYGEEESVIQSMIRENQLNESVMILHRDYNVEALMNISEFMVLNSKDSEGFPIVILEAASIEKMHIGTRVGGIPEFINDGDTGIIVPPQDPEALATSIRSLVEHPEEYNRMGRNAKTRFFSQYTLEKMVDKIEVVYSSLIKNPR